MRSGDTANALAVDLKLKLVASNGLDEKKIANMELYEHAHFDSYGVGVGGRGYF